MQHILSIDAASSPSVALLLEVDENRRIRIIEDLRFSAADWLQSQVNEHEHSSEESPVEPSAEQNEEEESESAGQTSFDLATDKNILALKELHERYADTIEGSILVVPAQEYVSLNIELPFREPKRIEKILRLEVQDRLPFETEDFFFTHRCLNELSEGVYDIHVGLIPRQLLLQLLAFVRAADIEPHVITPPSSALGGVKHLGEQYVADDATLLYANSANSVLATIVQGEVVSDRILQSASNGDQQLNNEALMRSARLTLAATERRYGRGVKKVYLLGEHYEPSQAQQAVGREVEQLELSDFIEDSPSADHTLAALASVFVIGENPPQPLTNFRTGEFSYSPKLKELFRLGKALIPYASAACAAVLVFFLSLYAVGEVRIAKLESSISESIRTSFPEKNVPKSNELQWLLEEGAELHQQLNLLGSPSAVSPLEALSAITQAISGVTEVNFQKISIRGTRITLEGESEKYRKIDQIIQRLEKQAGARDIFCDVKKVDSSFGRRKMRGFSVEISLCS